MLWTLAIGAEHPSVVKMSQKAHREDFLLRGRSRERVGIHNSGYRPPGLMELGHQNHVAVGKHTGHTRHTWFAETKCAERLHLREHLAPRLVAQFIQTDSKAPASRTI